MESYKPTHEQIVSALELIETTPSVSLTFYEKDEPLAVHILRSGWSNPQLYHVLVEFGDRMETTVHLLEASQIKELFSIDDVVKSFKSADEMMKYTIH